MIIPSLFVTLKDNTLVEMRSVQVKKAQAFLDHLIIAHNESYQNLNRDGEHFRKMPLEDEKKLLQGLQDSPLFL